MGLFVSSNSCVTVTCSYRYTDRAEIGIDTHTHISVTLTLEVVYMCIYNTYTQVCMHVCIYLHMCICIYACMFYFVRLFKWVLGLELRPMLKWQTFYQLTHLPSSQQPSFFIGIFVMLEVTKRTQPFWWQREQYFRM